MAQDRRFCRLDALASVWLGLKTGNDRFFFVQPLGQPPALTLGSGRSRRIRVRGLNGWEGDIASTDLMPAVLNPHHLFHDESGRRFTVPAASSVLYLYPQDRSPVADLGSYVAVAEAQGVQNSALVRQNGSRTRWYRQSRTVRAAQWLLPYNSAFDYGAWENPHGGVINGRFVGVDPRDGIEGELLGGS